MTDQLTNECHGYDIDGNPIRGYWLDAVERAYENLAEAEMRGATEARLNVLRLRVRHAEATLKEAA